MKIKSLFAAVAALWVVSSHSSELLLGNFGHEFTRDKGDVVWKIQLQNNNYELLTTADNTPSALHLFSKSTVRALWKKFYWPESTALSAICLGNTEDIFCYVPPEHRKQIDWLAENKTNYFYYSKMAGVMEIQRYGR